jgi:hypothetical protein
VIEKLEIEIDFVLFTRSGRRRAHWCGYGKRIEVAPLAEPYDVAHEIGHVVCGDSCCREHAEFEAHGAAKMLCALLGLPLGDAEVRMDSYAGRSSHEACGRITP